MEEDFLVFLSIWVLVELPVPSGVVLWVVMMSLPGSIPGIMAYVPAEKLDVVL